MGEVSMFLFSFQSTGSPIVINIVGDLFISILSLWALYALISTGFSLSFNIGRFFDLSLGVSFLTSGYTAYAFTKVSILPLPVNMLFGIIMAGLISTALGFLLIVPLTKRVGSLSLFVATLSLLYLAQAIIGILFGENANVLRPGSAPSIQFGQLHLTDIDAAQILVTTILLSLLLVFIHKSRRGRYVRAISDDPILSRQYGIPVSSTLLHCYIIAGFLAGAAGVFYAANRAIEPTQAMSILLAAMVATIIGGESVGGAILGALMLAFLETIFGFAVSGNWKTTVAFTALLCFLVLRRGGAITQINRRL